MDHANQNTFTNAAKSTAAAVFLILVTTAIYLYLTSPGDLDPPAAKPAPSPESLGIVTALNNTTQPPFAQWDVSVHWKDIDSFHQHLEVAATQQGWFAYMQHRENLGSAAVIIMPADELHMLGRPEGGPRRMDNRPKHPASQAKAALKPQPGQGRPQHQPRWPPHLHHLGGRRHNVHPGDHLLPLPSGQPLRESVGPTAPGQA